MKADLRQNKNAKIKEPNDKWRVIILLIIIIAALIILGYMQGTHLSVGGI